MVAVLSIKIFSRNHPDRWQRMALVAVPPSANPTHIGTAWFHLKSCVSFASNTTPPLQNGSVSSK